MKSKSKKNSWDTLVELWRAHQENPKFSNDVSEVQLLSNKFQDEQIVVSHSFVLNNQKKLIILDPDLVCILDNRPVTIEEFGHLTISELYKLPRSPSEFSNVSARDYEATQTRFPRGDNSTPTNEEESFSNLIPLSSKNSEKHELTDEEKSIKPKNKKIKLAAIVLAPVVLLFLIFNITTNPIKSTKITKSENNKVNKPKVEKKQKSKISIKSDKKAIRKKVTKSTKPRRKTRPASVSKSKNKPVKKASKRRKKLMEKRVKVLPTNPDQEDIDDYGDENDLENEALGDENEALGDEDELPREENPDYDDNFDEDQGRNIPETPEDEDDDMQGGDIDEQNEYPEDDNY